MFMYFIGGAAGSLLGTTMWQQYGWLGVTVSGLVFQGCAFFFQTVVLKEREISKIKNRRKEVVKSCSASSNKNSQIKIAPHILPFLS